MKIFYFTVTIVLCLIGIMYMRRSTEENHETQETVDLEGKSISDVYDTKCIHQINLEDIRCAWYFNSEKLPKAFDENITVASINTDKYKFEVDLDKNIANLSVKEDYNPETPIEYEYQYYIDGIQMPDIFNENVNSRFIDKNKYNIEYDFSDHIVRLTTIRQSEEESTDEKNIYEELGAEKPADEKIVYEELKVNPNGYQVNGYHSGNNA